MGAKGRGLLNCTKHNSTEDDVLQQRKAFEISKALVWRSYQEVHRNKGAPGCDGQRIKQFTGSYFVHQMCNQEPYDGRLSRTVL